MNKVTRTNCSQCFKIRKSMKGNKRGTKNQNQNVDVLIACLQNFKEVIRNTYSRMTTRRLFVFLRDMINLLVDGAKRC